MGRSYSSRAVARTLGVEPKWLDNLLSHAEIWGVTRARQGIERRISDAGLVTIELVRLLVVDLGLPLSRAALLATTAARDAFGSTPEGVLRAESIQVATSSGLVLSVPMGPIQRRLRERLTEVVETLATVPRGRRRRRQ